MARSVAKSFGCAMRRCERRRCAAGQSCGDFTPQGQSQWGGGWIFDPEDHSTYHLSATLEANDTISARIYAGISWFGETKILTRIEPGTLPGRC